MNSSEVAQALRKRFQPPEYAIAFEVRSGTGYAVGRQGRADALVMSTYPSKGLELHGIEIKVSRSDFLSELKKPDKSNIFAQFCDRWWLVIGNKSVASKDEIPKNWGLMVPHGKGLRIAKQALALDPIPPDRLFMASLFRAALNAGGDVEKKLQNAFAQGERKGWKDGQAGKEEVDAHKIERLNRQLLAHKETFAGMKAAGIPVSPPYEFEHEPRVKGFALGESIMAAVQSERELRATIEATVAIESKCEHLARTARNNARLLRGLLPKRPSDA